MNDRSGLYYLLDERHQALLRNIESELPLEPKGTDSVLFTGNQPHREEPESQRLASTLKKIRVVALDYMATDIGRKHGPSAISDLAAWDVKVVLGETPVYEDGSAAFEVPARTPVYFQAIDAQGHVVQTMRSWSTLMPGEVFGCVGCHENKNETAAALPITMASRAGVEPLEPFYDITGKGFSFPKMVQPILDAKCVRCHDGSESPEPTGGDVSRNSLRRPRSFLPKNLRPLLDPCFPFEAIVVCLKAVGRLTKSAAVQRGPVWALGTGGAPL